MKDGLITVAWWIFIILIIIAFINYRTPNSIQSAQAPLPYPTYSSPTVDPIDQVTQGYWYCWDTGNPSPHHLGHPVMGDHLCTNRELGR